MKKKLRLFLCLVLAAALLTAGCSAADTTVNAASATAEAADTETNNELEETTMQSNPVATIEMEDGGIITVELYPDKAPNTVRNFISLANSGFYDGLIFHRVISGFMIQGGDPDGRGTGGPGYSIPGEFSANGCTTNDISHERGVISMARSSAYDSAGSQFFIMHADAAYLDGQYAAFGKVTAGMDVVDAIASVRTNLNDKPYTNQVIKSIRVETFGVDYPAPDHA